MKDLKLYLTLGVLLLGLYLFVEYNRPAPVDWTPTYQKTDKIPFGTYILYQELPSLFKKGVQSSRQSLYETLLRANGANLLILAPKINISAADYQKLYEHLKKGNNIFIAASDFNRTFLDSLHLETGISEVLFTKDSLKFHFLNKQLAPDQYYQFDRGIGASYFNKIDTAKATVLGTNNKGEANFLRYKVGKGSLYLLASPDFFTNYALLESKGPSYAAQLLSYLDPDRLLIYDEYMLLGMRGQQSLLRFIFSTPSLKWSYYIMLTSLVLFVLFEIKRRQRIIPLIDPMKNTSVEFVKVVSSVYFQQHDNNDIAEKKVLYFLQFIRANYRLKTNDLDNEFKAVLIARSGVASYVIDQILHYIIAINQGQQLSDQELITFNNYIEQFYEQSNIPWNKNFSNHVPI